MSIDLFGIECSSETTSAYNYFKSDAESWMFPARSYWNALYIKHRLYLDKDFLDKFPYDTMNFLWELTLVNYLSSGLNDVKPVAVPGKGKQSIPDFCLEIGGNKFYVEAISAYPGDPQHYPSINESLEDIEGRARGREVVDEYVQRLTSAFHEKAVNKFNSLVDKNGKVKRGYGENGVNGNGFVVAISMANIALYNQAGMPGLDISLFINGNPNARPIINHNGSPVPIYFNDPNFAHVSAVLISHAGQVFFPDIEQYVGYIKWPDCRNDFRLIHNPYAKVPLPRGLLPVIQEVCLPTEMA